MINELYINILKNQHPQKIYIREFSLAFSFKRH